MVHSTVAAGLPSHPGMGALWEAPAGASDVPTCILDGMIRALSRDGRMTGDRTGAYLFLLALKFCCQVFASSCSRKFL